MTAEVEPVVAVIAPRGEHHATLDIRLPGTASYVSRGLYFCPSPVGTVADPFRPGYRVTGVALLIIVRAKAFKTRATEVKTDWYCVEPIDTGRPDVVS